MIPGIVAAQIGAGSAQPSAPHAYWRISITAIQVLSPYAAITEIEMRATAGGADQCAGGTAIASGSLSPHAPDRAFDGIVTGSNYWISQSAIGGPRWIGYQFAAPVSVRQVVVVAENGSATAHQGDLKDFVIQYSDDGVTWTTAATFTNEPAWANNEQRLYAV